MPTIDFPMVQIKEYETQVIFPLATLAPGTYHTQLQIEGNSILSSLLVTNVAIGGAIEVNYFQTTTGDESNERTNLFSHETKLSGSQQAETITVSKVHLKPVCEVIITGAPVTFGVMATVVSSFTTDIEATLVTDDAIISGTERGLAAMMLDETDNKLKILRAVNNRLAVVQDEGQKFHALVSDSLDVDETKLILTHDCTLNSLKISQITATSLGRMRFELFIDGDKKASIMTNDTNATTDLKFHPYHVAPVSSIVTVNAKRLAGTGTEYDLLDFTLNGFEGVEQAELMAITKLVLNSTGSLILPFKAVAWLDDNTITLADADVVGITDFAGVTVSSIANGAYGKILKMGELPNALAGLGAVAGQPVYLGVTPGELTLTAPTTGAILRIGFAEPPSGSISGDATSLFVNPQLISEL